MSTRVKVGDRVVVHGRGAAEVSYLGKMKGCVGVVTAARPGSDSVYVQLDNSGVQTSFFDFDLDVIESAPEPRIPQARVVTYNPLANGQRYLLKQTPTGELMLVIPNTPENRKVIGRACDDAEAQ